MTEKLLPTAAGSTAAASAGAALDLSRWPQWMREALAYKPESIALAVETSTKAAPLETTERRNIRVLTRVSST